MPQETRTFWTIGHSTRSFDELADILAAHGVTTIADIRRFPGSRRHPHFSTPEFERLLATRDVAYLHVPELGGRRRLSEGSRNTAWRNPSFRAYADHMGSQEFHRGIERVLALQGRVSLLCAEAVPWRCHRQLVSDEFLRRGCDVIHILDTTKVTPHALHPEAILLQTHVEYTSQLSLGLPPERKK